MDGMTKVKIGLISAIVAAVTVLLIVQHRSQVTVRQENVSLRQQIERLSGQRQQTSLAAPQTSASHSGSEEQSKELLRLRGELAQLRKSIDELGKHQVEQSRSMASRATPDESFPSGNPDVLSEIAGIGLALARPNTANGVVSIQRVLPDSPAAAAGLWPLLAIHRVNGVELAGRSMAECVGLIRGPVGTKVELELSEPLQMDQTFTVELIRQRIAVQTDPAAVK
jgi:C-terminal processing protease CtpA/Prc